MPTKIPSFNIARLVAEADEKDMKVQLEIMDNLDQTGLLAELDKLDRNGLVNLVRYCDAFITGQYLKDKMNEMVMQAVMDAMAQNGQNTQNHNSQDIPDNSDFQTGMYI
jgi:hypothetical protein